ncbi:hypothetical protein PVL29_004865 [Vitis rotundifolia]|uniref:Pentatricopeptide repeat-containing protein n=1 Tax=Vitis rotundifolia TaxID=103349 RepID=A0AA39A919_VITRO|nr:hypothetical protein PVL29_004865 [Vitis rotundifolia]
MHSPGQPIPLFLTSAWPSWLPFGEPFSSILSRCSSLVFILWVEKIGDMMKVQDLNVILRHFGKLCSSYIKFMGKSLNPKALEIYNSIHDESIRNNVSVCNSILICLVRNGKFESSLKLFHQMKQDSLRPQAVTYSTTLELVQEMECSKLPMDSLIYGTFLAVCASNNRCREAENYFNQMKDEGHLPNVFHYSSLLNNYLADGDYKKAFMLVILTTLLKLYVRGGLFEKSRELLMPYCLLMDGIAKSRHILKVKSIFEEMKKKKKTTFCRGGLLKEAKQFARDFEATSIYTSSDISPCRKTFFTSNCCNGQSRFAAKDSNTRIVLILATGANVSVDSILLGCIGTSSLINNVIGLLFKINGNEARWLLANSQISQHKPEISLFTNKL